jgi:hypothetical protein
MKITGSSMFGFVADVVGRGAGVESVWEWMNDDDDDDDDDDDAEVGSGQRGERGPLKG